mmetsp:Transcript_20429/g.38239  ORF Transcript_20429/g.38239 Transcript_20429/m.38239 type:complete len:235 (+) Transcript_20429:160-864(+)
MVYRTRAVGTDIVVSELMSERLTENVETWAYWNGKCLIWTTQLDELFVVDCKQDISQYSICPTPFKHSSLAKMVCLKNRVFLIDPQSSLPSRQFNLKQQEWRELAPLPGLIRPIEVRTVEATEKLYVYTAHQTIIQELDLNALRWRTIRLPSEVHLKPCNLFCPEGSSLIFVDRNNEVIVVDPEQGTVSKVGELATRKIHFGFVHEGIFVQHYCRSSSSNERLETHAYRLKLAK